MREQLSEVDDSQLERWAYGRANTSDERTRAAEAAKELKRRADLLRTAASRAESERPAAESAEGGLHASSFDEVVDEPSGSGSYRSRMLAGVVSAGTVTAIVIGAFVLGDSSQSTGPLAVFRTEETQLDRNWASRLESWGYSALTAGPRAVEVGDDFVMIAARVSTVPEGRSTEWDSYCLFVASPGSEDGAWALNQSCISPEEFEREGVSVVARVSRATDEVDVASWGPDSGPRFDAGRSFDELPTENGSTLSPLADPLARYDGDSRVLSGVIDPEELLMGPSVVHDAPLPSGDVVSVQLHLREGLLPTEGSEPELCMSVAHTESASSQTCKPLQAALDSGISQTDVIAGDSWVIGVDVDGVVQVQRD